MKADCEPGGTFIVSFADFTWNSFYCDEGKDPSQAYFDITVSAEHSSTINHHQQQQQQQQHQKIHIIILLRLILRCR
jgi:hypothetical protein